MSCVCGRKRRSAAPRRHKRLPAACTSDNARTGRGARGRMSGGLYGSQGDHVIFRSRRTNMAGWEIQVVEADGRGSTTAPAGLSRSVHSSVVVKLRKELTHAAFEAREDVGVAHDGRLAENLRLAVRPEDVQA